MSIMTGSIDEAAGVDIALAERVLFDWMPILENRDNAIHLNKAFDVYYSIRDNRELLVSFYQNFLQQCHVVLYRNEIYAGDVFKDAKVTDPFRASRHPDEESFKNYIFTAVGAVRAALEGEDRAERLIDRIKEYIDFRIRRYSAHLSREEIAKEFYINPNYLSSLFKAEEGMSLSTYICKCRISVAKQLLEENDDTISKICDRVGYVNAAYFSKVFKKETGMTPKEYRDIHNKE